MPSPPSLASDDRRPAPPPRYAPLREFPPYAYITGRSPHPHRDSQGHSYAAAEVIPPPLDPFEPMSSEEFLYGIDLFNHGYYWEAHEAWEGLWRVSRGSDRGAASPTTLLLQALIKLAAAGFKVRQGRLAGVRSHAGAAAKLLRTVSHETGSAVYCGLSIGVLISFAERVSANPPAGALADSDRAAPVFGIYLVMDAVR